MAERRSASKTAAGGHEGAGGGRERPAGAGGAQRRQHQQATADAEAVARRYFEAIDARELDAAVAMWAPGGRENVRGQVDVHRAGGRARVHRRAARRDAGPAHGGRRDDHRGRSLRGAVAPHGHVRGPGSAERRARRPGSPLKLEGLDLLTVRDGLIQSNDAFTDTMGCRARSA